MARNYLIVLAIVWYGSYSMLTGLWGESGYFANNFLRKELLPLENNLARLDAENLVLELERSLLETDYDRIREEAYRYGYLQQDEFRLIMEESFDNAAESGTGNKLPEISGSAESATDSRFLTRIYQLRLSRQQSALGSTVLVAVILIVRAFRRKRRLSGKGQDDAA